MSARVDRFLVVALLLVAGANLRAAIEFSPDADERIGLAVLSIIGVMTAWPWISKAPPR